MSRKKPEWEKLEIIVAKIRKQLAPEADVQHNHRVKGKSGRWRKLDVTVSQKVSEFPVFIVFDCKHHSRPVGLEAVEAFAGQLRDVGATLGVMISSSGFDAGARAIAKENRIILQVFRNAEETDWKKLFGESAWATLLKFETLQVKVFALIVGMSTPTEIPLSMSMFDKHGEMVDNLNDIFWDLWKQLGKPIGDFKVDIGFEEFDAFFRKGEELLQIQSISVNIKLTAKKILVNLNMAEGNVLEDVDSDKPVYRSVASKGFDWAETLNNETGIEVGSEEYQQILRESVLLTDLSNVARYVRIVAEDKGE